MSLAKLPEPDREVISRPATVSTVRLNREWPSVYVSVRNNSARGLSVEGVRAGERMTRIKRTTR